MEGDSGIVARTYGTCVLLEKIGTMATSSRSLQMAASSPRRSTKGLLIDSPSTGTDGMAKEGMVSSPLHSSIRRLDIVEDSPIPSDTNRSPKSPKTTASLSAAPLHNPTWWRQAVEAAARHRDSHDEGDIHLLTMRDFDTTVRVRLGVSSEIVCARGSVCK